MFTLLRVLFLSTLCVGLSYCSTFSGSSEPSETEENLPRYNNYHSSGIYEDIEKESRTPASTDYLDDDYGDLQEEQDEGAPFISDVQEDEEPIKKTATQPTAVALPVQKANKPKKSNLKRKSIKKTHFKNGMYRVTTKCSMRSKASTQSKKMGEVSKGKKLWMENHNTGWVKIFKKSGPVYISKKCL